MHTVRQPPERTTPATRKADHNMTDENNQEPVEQPGDPQPSGADPATRIAEAVEKEHRSIDDFPAEDRKLIDEYAQRRASRAVNDALEAKRKDGDIVTRKDVDEAIAKAQADRDAEWERKAELQRFLDSTLQQEHGISPGSPEYDKFSEVQTHFKVDNLKTKEGIELIVRAAGLGAPKEPDPSQPWMMQPPRGLSAESVPMVPQEGVPLSQLANQEE